MIPMDDLLVELTEALDDPDSAAWSVDTAEGGWAAPSQDEPQGAGKSS